MMPFLLFTFATPWHFAGVVLLIMTASRGVARIFRPGLTSTAAMLMSLSNKTHDRTND